MAPNEAATTKVRLMCDFTRTRKEHEVPDPYFGGKPGFDLVIDILEDACAGLLCDLKAQARPRRDPR